MWWLHFLLCPHIMPFVVITLVKYCRFSTAVIILCRIILVISILFTNFVPKNHCVKYRNKIGMDVCGEILNSYLKREDKDLGLLHEYARKLRVDNVLTNYLATRL